MFTGIIDAIGEITRREDRGDLRFEIASPYDLSETALGASIACAGACLTVVAKDPTAGRFEVDVSAESLDKTTLGDWKPGVRINMERALKVGDELGGHIVSGHVDGVAHVVGVTTVGDSWEVRFQAPKALSGFIAPKGSVALDGCSLTVNDVWDTPQGAQFSVNLISHTRANTTFAALAEGTRLNLEIDVLARYVARMNALTSA